MQNYSYKNRMQVITHISKLSNYSNFMSLQNQAVVAKKIYQLHHSNNGVRGYLYFKQILPSIMDKWAKEKNINNYVSIGVWTSDILLFINREFVKENTQLYDNPDIHKQMPDVNVYKSKAFIGTGGDNCDLNVKEVNFKDLYAEDIKNLDVWGPTATYTQMGRDNRIPAWRKALSSRNYDRDANGFRSSIEKSSYINTNSGFDMSDLIKKADDRLRRQN